VARFIDILQHKHPLNLILARRPRSENTQCKQMMWWWCWWWWCYAIL